MPIACFIANRTATLFGIIRPAGGTVTRVCASTICYCRRRPSTASPAARSTRRRAARTGPRTTPRSGANSPCEAGRRTLLVKLVREMVRQEFDLLRTTILKADRATPGFRIGADNGRGKRDRLARPGDAHHPAHSGTDQFADAVEQCSLHRPIDRTKTLIADRDLQNRKRMAAVATQVACFNYIILH